MRAGDFEMADFEAHGKRPIKTALSPMRISTKITRMERFEKSFSSPSLRLRISTNTAAAASLAHRSSLKNSWLI